MKNSKPSRPSDFNLFLASDAVQGTLEAIFELTAEVPAEGPEFDRWFGSLSGLAWNGRRAAREAQHFLREASEHHHFPVNYDQLDRHCDECDRDVREPRLCYGMKQ